jgi:Tfp pilus assembly protein PilN
MAPKKVNLLPKDQFEFSATGKFIQWAVSIGRWIVVLTEFVVICAFLSRFYFDTVQANLFDETKQKQAIIQSAASFEENFRDLQTKVKLVKALLAEEKEPSGLISQISNKLPLNVTLTRVSIETGELRISGFTLSERGLSVFVSGLAEIPQLEKVNLTNVSLDPEEGPGIMFSLSARVNETKEKKRK